MPSKIKNETSALSAYPPELLAIFRILARKGAVPARRVAYQDFTLLRLWLASNPGIQVEGTWAEGQWRVNPQVKPDIHKEDSYERCVQWDFSYVTRKITVSMWNGYMMDGSRESLRCHWVVDVSVAVPRELLHLLEQVADIALRELAERAREEERLREEAEKVLLLMTHWINAELYDSQNAKA